MKQWISWLAVLSTSILLAGCSESEAPEIAPGAEQSDSDSTDEETENAAETDEDMAALSIDMYNSNSERVGTAVFDEVEDGVSVTLNLEDIPSGTLRMEIHDAGLATPPNFEDSGEPISQYEVPEIEVSENGVVNQTVTLSEASLLPEEAQTLATEEGTSIVLLSGSESEQTQSHVAGGIIFPPQ